MSGPTGTLSSSLESPPAVGFSPSVASSPRGGVGVRDTVHYYWVSNCSSGQRVLGPAADRVVVGGQQC